MDELADYSNYQTASAIPEASSMIETFRAIGYSLESAIADIIDNSISANARNIWVDFEWRGAQTWLSIKDDGYGMTNEELIQAMKPGCKHPDDPREKHDLGRFGLGLKTASFSQCRILSVISKTQNSEPNFWTWDLNYVNQTSKWELIKYIPQNIPEDMLLNQSSGTIVIWNDIDRLVKDIASDNKAALEKFLHKMEFVKRHLAVVFHRFIDKNQIKLFFQKREIIAWDPFLQTEPATQPFPEEPIFNGLVKMKGFVLPHKSKLDGETFKKAEGVKGWNEHQGFYIYRNERLILTGDWLGLFRKEEHYKLARIYIEIPNNLDMEWQVDIMKSVARPPLMLKEQLKAYAVKVRNQAVEVYRHRGKSVKPFPGQQFVPLWLEHKRHDKWFYKINREHPVISRLKFQLNTGAFSDIENLLKFIEETVPSKSIYIKEAEEPETQGKPFESADHEPVRKIITQIYQNLRSEGRSIDESKAIISNIEPFNLFPHLIELLN